MFLWQEAIMRTVASHSVLIAGRYTSVSLEKPFWDCLREIAEQRGKSLNQLIASSEAKRNEGNLSSAIRLFVLRDHQRRMRKMRWRGCQPQSSGR
jgi:predicted DNA-binding ribbon-helix-helix protein